MKNETVLAWYFIKDDCRMQYSDELVEVGKTYVFDGEPKLCEQGYHASILAIDALLHAPGNVICRVEMSGKIIQGADKIVATHRKVLSMANAESELRSFSRWCALEVSHLWDMPDIVKNYLETGDDSRRNAARVAASDAASDAARAAAWDAALDAARAAARDAASAAARAAARAAASDESLDKFNTELEIRLAKLLEAK